MKIRILNNSVRLRLTKTDIASLKEENFVEGRTHFAANVLTYRLQVSEAWQTLSAVYENNTIHIYISPALAEELINTDRIGVEDSQVIDEANALFILVEKDFQCLDHSREDQSDMYINPNKTC